jgi:arylsulfatase A-like enzyme
MPSRKGHNAACRKDLEQQVVDLNHEVADPWHRPFGHNSDQLLKDRSATFVSLHMPIPHGPNIYNRQTASFATSNPSYLDNLALCDVYLGHVRKELEENGTWDSTTLVLMGDHSWRITSGAGLAPEELAASDGGQFDDRPAYIVKLAHQNTPERIDTLFTALRTRDLFDNLLTGRITTSRQLAGWVQHAN